jgi:hypothetical protein
MRKNVTRRGRLENKLRAELALPNPEVGRLLDAIDEFEADNIATIEKLKKKKQIDTKRINGALRQTIHAHGDITKLLIGSATKRIYGSLLSDQSEDENDNNKWSFKSLSLGFSIGVVISLLTILFIS